MHYASSVGIILLRTERVTRWGCLSSGSEERSRAIRDRSATESPTILRVAAERADCWNTAGPLGLGMDQILEITHRQSDRLDEMCVASGREPTELRRSLFLVGALDAWASPDAVKQIVKCFGEIGIGEFVLFWPPDERLDLFEHVATETIPALRTGLSP